jgi:multidrug efflux pump
MHFTDIFIKRPVLAVVVSLVILLLGLRAGLDLNVREYPDLQNAQITVSVAYPGADPELVEGFITTPLEREIATADGIDFLTSNSSQSVSSITANLLLTKDPNEALTEISTKVNKLRSQLPDGAEDPVIQLANANSTASMYLSFSSESMSKTQITDYLTRIVEPELVSISGIESIIIDGGQPYAMRVWLDSAKLKAHDLSASEVFDAIRRENVLSAVGQTKGAYVRIGMAANTDLNDLEGFRNLVVRSEDNAMVKLKDVATVEFGTEDYDAVAYWDESPGVFIGIFIRPDANLLDVIDQVKSRWPDIVQAMPEGLDGVIGYDSTIYVDRAIADVQATLIEAVIIVIVVIFLFLGSLRSSVIPAVTVPLSLIGALFFMYSMGFSINLLTMLAMVLAIGMVVDDAIIVLENIHRHIEEGMSPRDAAIKGGRELVGPVIAMTITLVAVYAPIGFLTGITGTLFTEFAFTLAGAVLISGVIALTLTPMMCGKMLKASHGADGEENRMAVFLDEKFEFLRKKYKSSAHNAMNHRHVVGIFGLLVLLSCVYLYSTTASELAPGEDLGFVGVLLDADGYASAEYLKDSMVKSNKIGIDHPSVGHTFAQASGGFLEANQGFVGLIGKPWDERDQSMSEVAAELTPQLNAVPGVRIALFEPPPLPTPGQGYPVELVLKSTADPITLAEVGSEVVGRIMASNRFFFAAPQLNFDRPESELRINREKAALMGVDMQSLSADLIALMAGAEVNRFAYQGRSYKVIAQVQREERLNPQQLKDFYTRTRSGDLIPLSTVVDIVDRTVPRAITHAQQLNSNTIVAVPRPDVTQGEALEIVENIAAEVMPAGFSIDYSGTSRQLRQEGNALATTFLFAIIIIYLVLAAQFESFRDPLIILVTVPMSISGALLTINLLALTNGMQLSNFPGMTLNIYTQVGLITLIGVISKHGILIVDFANRLQKDDRLSKREAIEEATSIRLRPILMTTAALVMAMIPLLLASGPGASSRFAMGLVIASGMSIGTLFTLYVVPAMYLYVGRDYGHAKQADA